VKARTNTEYDSITKWLLLACAALNTISGELVAGGLMLSACGLLVIRRHYLSTACALGAIVTLML
jgi:hypothetical protein